MTAPTDVPVRQHDTDEAFVAELQAFLAEHHPGLALRGRMGRLEWRRRFAATLYDHGWAGPAWPSWAGGLDLPVQRQVLYHRVLARAGVPGHPNPNLGTVGPTLIRHGTPAQRERFLPAMLRGDELWAQGFSEPEAGSDLSSLRTTAVPDGDAYLVTGVKVWSTAADVSDWMFALVRTGSADSGRHGITYLLVDLSSPGITVRPIRDLTGGSDFSEVVFDGVRVPVRNRVGDEHGGWPIARTSLGHERSAASAARAHRYQRVVEELVDLAGRRGATHDPMVRQHLAAAWSDARILGLLANRTLTRVLRDGEPGPESSVARLFHSRFEQRLHELAVDLLGPAGLLDRASDDAVEGGRWCWGLLRTRASTIGAGTAEVQRTTIGERVLGLPTDAGGQ